MCVSAVIVTYNSQEHISKCLCHLSASRLVPAEVIVVDNGSTDGTRRVLDAFRRRGLPIQVILNSENVGYAVACNQGADMARCPIILFLNADAFVMPDSIGYLVEALMSDPTIGFVGPQLLNEDGSLQLSWAPFETPATYVLRTLAWRHHPAPASSLGEKSAHLEGYVSGACLMMKREAWTQLRGFDEGFFFYGEEMDLQYRGYRQGLRAKVIPTARVYHVRGGSTRCSGSRQRLRNDVARVRFLLKHYPSFPSMVYAMLLMVRLARTSLRTRRSSSIRTLCTQLRDDIARFHIRWSGLRLHLTE